MSLAEDFISDLDAELVDTGENIVLRRRINGSSVEVTCPASVNYLSPETMLGKQQQPQIEVIISPTQIVTANWPGGPTVARDAHVPIKDDEVWVAGVWRKVLSARPKYISGVLARITISASG